MNDATVTPQVSVEALDALFAPLDRSDGPGGAVGIEIDGRRVYARGFGLASIESGLANASRTRMRIGSSSKQFCCLAIHLLAAEGRLELDAPVQRWIGELSPALPAVTLRQLMTNTSGIRCYLDLLFVANGLGQVPEHEVLAAIARQRDTQFEPGQRMLYSNSGCRLLSLVIERATGQPFETVLRERIFEPLAMFDTGLQRSDLLMQPGLAGTHLALPGGAFARGMMPTTLLGEGGLVSSIDDLLRWTVALRRGAIGGDAVWRAMLETPAHADGAGESYACGLIDQDWRGLRVVHHPGGVIGGNSQLLIAPDAGLGIAILVNRADVSAAELTWRVLETLLPQTAERRPRAVAADDALAGFYRRQGSGRVVCLAAKDGVLYWDGATHLAPLHRDGAGRIALVSPGVSDLAITPLADGRRGAIDITQCGLVERFTPVDANPADADRARLAGRYWSEDAQATLTIHADGAIAAELGGRYGCTRWTLERLLAVDADADAPTELWLLRPVDLPLLRWIPLRAVRGADGIEALELNTNRVWGLRFVRLPDREPVQEFRRGSTRINTDEANGK